MTNDFAKSVYNSSKSICYNLCEKITAVIDDLINKAKNLEYIKLNCDKNR